LAADRRLLLLLLLVELEHKGFLLGLTGIVLAVVI
jgi:hypothetical protein